MNNQVYNIDCIIGMKEYPDNYFDLAVVDPPYGIGEDGKKTRGRTFNKNGNARKSIDKRTGRKAVIFNTYIPKEWDKSYPEQKYFDELFRLSKNIIIWGVNYIQFNQKKESTGILVWDKVNFNNDFSDCELAWTNLFSSVRQFEFMWNGMLQGKSVREGRVNQGNKALCEKRIHPTQKPVKLYEWIFKNYAEEGQKILDTHLGSGSSRIAAYNYNMDFTGYELDKDYFESANKRFQEHIAANKFKKYLWENGQEKTKQSELFGQ